MLLPLALLPALPAAADTGAEPPADVEQIEVPGTKPSRPSVPKTFGSSDIRDWYAPDNRTLIINTYAHGRFKATLAVPCTGLRSAESLGFSTMGPVELDRTTTVILPDGQRCRFNDLSVLPDDYREDAADE